MGAPEGEPRGASERVNELVGLLELAVEAVIEVAKLEQLQVCELDHLQGFFAIIVNEHGRRPFGHEQIARL